jgi:hypothetical protein
MVNNNSKSPFLNQDAAIRDEAREHALSGSEEEVSDDDSDEQEFLEDYQAALEKVNKFNEKAMAFLLIHRSKTEDLKAVTVKAKKNPASWRLAYGDPSQPDLSS